METVDAAIARLEAAPDDVTPIGTVVAALGDLAPPERAEAVERIQGAVAGHAASLTALGKALYAQSWRGCELLGARASIAALAVDPSVGDAIDTVIRCLSYVSPADASSLTDEALKLTGRDPRLLTAKGQSLAEAGDGAGARQLASEAVEGTLARLAAAPGDTTMIETLVAALERADPRQRAEAAQRGRRALAGHPGDLVAFGRKLYAQSWPGRELLGARALLDALAEDPGVDGGVEALYRAMSYLSSGNFTPPVEEPLFDEALSRTGRDPRLLETKARWLTEQGHTAEAGSLATEAAQALIASLQADPENTASAENLAGLLYLLDPPQRADMVARAQQTLSGYAGSLTRFGLALTRHAWRLLGARVLVAALALDPHVEGALTALAGAAGQLGPPEGEPLINEAMRVTGRDPRLLVTKARWLADQEDAAGARRLAAEAADAVIAGLQADPEETAFTDALMAVLRQLEPAQRADVVARAQQALSGHAGSLTRLGLALARQDSAEWRLLGARVLVAALTVDAEVPGGVDGFNGTLAHLSRADAEPLVGEALGLTGRDPRILVAWGNRLSRLGDGDAAEDAVLEAVRRDGSLLDIAINDICTYYSRRRLNNRMSRWLDRLEAVAGRAPAVLIWRVSLYQLRGQHYAAIPILEEVLQSGELPSGARSDWVETLFTVRRDLGQQAELDKLLDLLESAAEREWESSSYGRSRVFHWRARAALYFRDASRANFWLQKVREIGAGLGFDVVDTEPAQLALFALEGRASLLRDASAAAATFRQAAFDLSDAGSRLILREEAVRRAQQDTGNARCPLYFDLGLELAELGRHDKAIEAYQQAHDLWEKPVEEEGFWQFQLYSMHNIAVSYEHVGQYEKAVGIWRQAKAVYDAEASQSSDPYLNWARSSTYLRLDELGMEYQACLRGLESDSESTDLLLRLIELDKEWRASRGRRAFERQGQSRTTMPDPAADPDESLAWRSRDAARQVRHLLTERIKASRNAANYRDCADFLLDKVDYRTARDHIMKAIGLDPDNPENRKLMARWYERDGNNRAALIEYEAALELDPDDFQVKSALGQVHVKLGNRDAARTLLSQVRETAPAHVETLIRLADLYTDMGDESDDTAYETAIDLYQTTLDYHRAGTGSKFLSTSEMAAILYQMGYCRVKLYEATPNAIKSRRYLLKAIEDFRGCLHVDSSHDKARAAYRKLTTRDAQMLLSRRERYGPWIILGCALFVLALAQVRYLTGHLSAASYATLTLGGVVLAIAGLVLPELLKLKVGGVELEKSPVEQQHRPASFNLSR